MEYTILKIKQQITDLIAQALGLDLTPEQLEITVPPDSALGDLAVPCFSLAKLTRLAPDKIATDLVRTIKPGGIIKQIKDDGPYLNFFIDPAVLGEQVIGEIQKQKTDYGRLSIGGAKIMLEYSQPNTHKEFHIGHLRNAVLGGSLVNLLKAAGHKVIAANYIGDVGAHVAKCLWAYEKFHRDDPLPANKGKFLGGVYTEAAQKTEANPTYKKEAAEVLQKLEAGDRYWLALWRKTRDWSLEEFNAIYKTLGLKFDQVFYESEVEKPGKKIVAELLTRGIAEKSDGAVIVNLEKYGLKNFLLLKSDGASLYATKELALAKLKFEKFKIDQSIVVVDTRQSFYFRQFFQVMELIGFTKPLIHIPYEFVTLKDGAMASRKGNVVLFEDFYAAVTERAKAETKKRHPDWPTKKIVAAAGKIARGAIKFNMLKVGNNSIIVFDIDEALSFDGFSGPYVQYTVSRINSVIKKARFRAIGDVDYSRLATNLEKELLLKLATFPETVKAAALTYEPSLVAKYLFDLSRLFSTFYQQEPIISSPPAVKKARLFLSDGTRQVLTNGLDLLGIEVLEQM